MRKMSNDAVLEIIQPTTIKNPLKGNPTIGIPQLYTKSRFLTIKSTITKINFYLSLEFHHVSEKVFCGFLTSLPFFNYSDQFYQIKNYHSTNNHSNYN